MREYFKNRSPYLFAFTDEKAMPATVNLTDDKDIIIYQVILFFSQETDTVIVFGLNYEALNPAPKIEVATVVQDDSPEIIPMETGGFAMLLSGTGPVLDPNIYPNLNDDSIINFVDFAMFAANWQKTGDDLAGDFDDSKAVDVNDMETLAYFWLANTEGPNTVIVFDTFKNALLADDIDTAVSCFTDLSAENYGPFLQQIRPYFTEMANDMGDLVPISSDDNTEKHDLLREEGGVLYG